MADQQPKPPSGPNDLAPGTVAGEIDFHDKVAKPFADALKDVADWKKSNGGKR